MYTLLLEDQVVNCFLFSAVFYFIYLFIFLLVFWESVLSSTFFNWGNNFFSILQKLHLKAACVNIQSKSGHNIGHWDICGMRGHKGRGYTSAVLHPSGIVHILHSRQNGTLLRCRWGESYKDENVTWRILIPPSKSKSGEIKWSFSDSLL